MKLPDAAALIGIHYRTMYRWAEEGDLPVWRIGRKAVRVSRADVLALITRVDR